MANTYTVNREIGAGGHNPHHNNKWSIYKTPAHSSTGKSLFTFAGDRAEERAAYLCEMMQRDRVPEEERFLQRILSGDKAADDELRAIVGAKPRSRGRAA